MAVNSFPVRIDGLEGGHFFQSAIHAAENRDILVEELVTIIVRVSELLEPTEYCEKQNMTEIMRAVVTLAEYQLRWESHGHHGDAVEILKTSGLFPLMLHAKQRLGGLLSPDDSRLPDDLQSSNHSWKWLADIPNPLMFLLDEKRFDAYRTGILYRFLYRYHGEMSESSIQKSLFIRRLWEKLSPILEALGLHARHLEDYDIVEDDQIIVPFVAYRLLGSPAFGVNAKKLVPALEKLRNAGKQWSAHSLFRLFPELQEEESRFILDKADLLLQRDGDHFLLHPAQYQNVDTILYGHENSPVDVWDSLCHINKKDFSSLIFQEGIGMQSDFSVGIPEILHFVKSHPPVKKTVFFERVKDAVLERLKNKNHEPDADTVVDEYISSMEHRMEEAFSSLEQIQTIMDRKEQSTYIQDAIQCFDIYC